MNNVSFNPGVKSVGFTAKADKVENTNYLKQDAAEDSFEFEHKNNGAALSKEDKQEILQKARSKAAGYSVFGGIFSTLYYGLRSDKKVAKKYDLDVEKDKKFIKQIKKEQTLWTLPASIPGMGILPGIVSYVYNKNLDPSDLEVK